MANEMQENVVRFGVVVESNRSPPPPPDWNCSCGFLSKCVGGSVGVGGDNKCEFSIAIPIDLRTSEQPIYIKRPAAHVNSGELAASTFTFTSMLASAAASAARNDQTKE